MSSLFDVGRSPHERGEASSRCRTFWLPSGMNRGDQRHGEGFGRTRALAERSAVPLHVRKIVAIPVPRHREISLQALHRNTYVELPRTAYAWTNSWGDAYEELLSRLQKKSG